MFESGRHHADYLNCLSIELNFPSDDAWITSETACPKAIGEDDHVISARFELFGLKNTTARRSNAHQRKEIGSRCETE